jgi:hypothetical protein
LGIRVSGIEVSDIGVLGIRVSGIEVSDIGVSGIRVSGQVKVSLFILGSL